MTVTLYQLSYTAYRYHAHRISWAIMFNNVVYQATTDGRAFQLIPFSLISVVRSSTSGLLVASDTDNTPLHHGNHCRSGVQQLESTALLSVLVVTNISKNVLLSLVEGEGFEPPMSYALCRYLFQVMPSTTRPTFQYIYPESLVFSKPADHRGGLETIY